MLTVATPKSSKLAVLKLAGLIAPDEISSVEDAVPEDFTRLNNRELGAVHSRYAVRYAHAIFVHANWVSDIIIAKRNRFLAESQFSIRYREDYKTKYELDAAMDEDRSIKNLRDIITKLESEAELIDAVARGYDIITKAASREISRRGQEVAPRD